MIGDLVSIAPGVTLASNVQVGDGVTIGAGAVVVPNITIGEGAVIGAGSLIRKDIEPGSFWAGNPAVSRELNRQRSALNTSGEE
jgi:acetyltransferase-like isoleucine patch superfamily enzyme